MQKLLDDLNKEILEFFNNVDKVALIPTAPIEEIQKHLVKSYSFEKNLPLNKVTADVQQMLRNWTLHNNHPHYLGLFVPATLMPSVIADTLTALYNPQLGLWIHAPGACEIERFTLQHLMKKFSMDPVGGSANFTTGGTEANLSAVLTALIKYFPEYGENGLRSLKKQPVFYVSEEAHHSFIKIGQVTGLGCQAVRNVPADSDFKLDLVELKKMLKQDMSEGLAPFLVVATAGTTSAGVIDPLPELAKFCQENNLWYHLDAAYGGAAIMSEKLKHVLKGIELADSITCDAHKWFSVSMSAGMFFCRHRKYVADAFHAGAAYLPESAKENIDSYNTTLQCSRRFIGLKLFMTLAHLGDRGYAELIDRQTDLGSYLRDELKRAGFKIINNTMLPVVCFTHKVIEEGQFTTSDILERLYARKNFWISQTKLSRKISVLRACITNFRTTRDDIDELVCELSQAVKSFKENKTVLN